VKKDVIVVAGAEDLVGFKLAGVSETHLPDEEGLGGLLIEKDALIFITEDAASVLDDDMDGIMEKNIVQLIPSHNTQYDRVADIIKQTIGFDLKR